MVWAETNSLLQSEAAFRRAVVGDEDSAVHASLPLKTVEHPCCACAQSASRSNNRLWQGASVLIKGWQCAKDVAQRMCAAEDAGSGRGWRGEQPADGGLHRCIRHRTLQRH